MTVSTYEPTYEAAPTTSEDSMFGTPVYARRVPRRDRNNKLFMGAAAVGAVVALGALFFATSAANDREDAVAVAAAEPIAPAPASRALPATPVATPVTPAAEAVIEVAALRPTPTAAPRAAPAPRARSATTARAASAPSAADAAANVSTREYAPVTPEPAAAPDAAPAPVMVAEPPAAAPIPLIEE